MRGIIRTLTAIPKRHKGIISDYYREYNDHNYKAWFDYIPNTKNLEDLQAYYAEFKRKITRDGSQGIPGLEACCEDQYCRSSAAEHSDRPDQQVQPDKTDGELNRGVSTTSFF